MPTISFISFLPGDERMGMLPWPFLLLLPSFWISGKPYRFNPMTGRRRGGFIILVTGVFLEANGIYHFGAYAVGKMVRQKA